MSNITDLQTKINTYNTAFAEYFKSPELLATLIKTFTSHNITIEDWNTVVQTVKDNLELTPDIKEIINNVEACLEELYEYVPDIANKVTKVNTPSIVYGTDVQGNQYTYGISENSSLPNTVPIRRDSGHLYAGNVGDNFAPNDAVSNYHVTYLLSQKETEIKDYVSDNYETKQNVATAIYNLSTQKENMSNKVTTISSFSTDTEYPSAKAVNDFTYNRGYIDITFATKAEMTRVYQIAGSASVYTLNNLLTPKTAQMNGYVYNMSTSGNLVNEDNSTISVSVGDNVVFVWQNGDWYWDKMAGMIDLSGYVQKTTTIAGIDLQDNILAQELTDNLVFATNSDIDSLF